MEHPENSEEYKGLTVNAGIEQPSIVNPYLKLRKKVRRREFTVDEFVDGIVKGNMTVLSQAVTLVESTKPEHQAVAQEVIEKCLPYSGHSVRIGISGVPGAGKSTYILKSELLLEFEVDGLRVSALNRYADGSRGYSDSIVSEDLMCLVDHLHFLLCIACLEERVDMREDVLVDRVRINSRILTPLSACTLGCHLVHGLVTCSCN